MSVFSVVIFSVALSFLYFIIRNINKNKILFEQSAIWILIGLLMGTGAIFPKIPTIISQLLGFQVTSNFVLFVAVLLLMCLLFLQTIQISKQKEDIKNLVQEFSLLKKSISESEHINE